MLKWVFADEDSELNDTFELEANGANLGTLDYMAPNFKLVDEDPEFFDARVKINGERLNYDSFEWRQGTLSHKIAEKV